LDSFSYVDQVDEDHRLLQKMVVQLAGKYGVKCLSAQEQKLSESLVIRLSRVCEAARDKKVRAKAEAEAKAKEMEEMKAKQEEDRKKREKDLKAKRKEEEAKRKVQNEEDRARGYRIMKQTTMHVNVGLAAPLYYFDKPTGASGQIRRDIIEGVLYALGELTQREVDSLLRSAGVQGCVQRHHRESRREAHYGIHYYRLH
jgi:cobalamin biosynthesis Mg chelatase CobN